MKLLTKILANTKDDAGCAIWQGTKARGTAYIKIKLSDGTKRQTTTRRMVWELKYGEIPKDMHVTSTCGTPFCVHPDHLKLSSRSEINKKNGNNKIYKYKRVSRIAEHFRAKSKFTWGDILEIRTSSKSQRELAEKYGVHPKTIFKIKNNQMWRDLNSPWMGL